MVCGFVDQGLRRLELHDLENSIFKTIKDVNIVKLSMIIKMIDSYDIKCDEPGSQNLRRKIKEAESIIRIDEDLRNLELAIETRNPQILHKQLLLLNNLASTDYRVTKHPSWVSPNYVFVY